MRNEMGNQNASAIKEEEEIAVGVPEKPQDASHEDVVNGENHIIPEVQAKDFHEKTASSDDLSVTKDINAERHESDEKEQGNKDSEPPSTYSEVATESNYSVSEENYVEKADSPFHVIYEKPLDSNLEEIMPINDKLQSHDTTSIRRETDAGEIERPYSNSESKNTSQDSKAVDGTITPLEEQHSLSSQESEEVLKLSMPCSMEEKQNYGNEIGREGNRDDLVPEESPCLEDKSLEMNICAEECETKGIEDKVQHGLGNHDGVGLPMKENLDNFSTSPTETAPEVSSLNPLAGSPEPQEKHIFQTEEINLTYGRSENRENKPDSDQARSSEQTIIQLMIDNSTPPMKLHESCCKVNGEENMLRMSSCSDSEKAFHAEGAEVIHNGIGSQGVSVDKKKFAATEQEQIRDAEEFVAMMPENFLVSNGLTAIDKYDEGEKTTEKLSVEETEKRNNDSSSRNSRHTTGAAEVSVSSLQSFVGENNLAPGTPTSPFNHQWGSELFSEAAEDRNKYTVNLKQYSSCNVFITEVSTSNAQKVSIQTPNPCSALEKINHVQEFEQNVQANSGPEAETEISLNQSNKQHLIGETSMINSKVQESVARVSIESNPDHPATRVKLRKSPSFEFGIPVDARSEESDQTPLLVRDKSLARNFSGHTNVRFQNTTIIPTDYGRKSLDYEPVAVEEKTIRMERSDSDVSRDSFMSLLRKDTKPSVEVSSERKESHVAEKKALESPSEELALTSLKTSAKRKPRSSLFSACICCTAATH